MRLVLTPPSPPKNVRNISAQAVISSSIPNVIIAKAVALCFVATYPSAIAKPSPPSPPMSGTASTGSQSPRALIVFSACAVQYPPRPKNTAWPKERSPACPICML